MNRRRPALCGAALGIILTLLTGCSLLTAPKQQGPAIHAGPSEPKLGADVVWGPEGDHTMDVVALLDDGVILADAERPAFLVGADGRERWRLPQQVKVSDEATAATVFLGAQVVPERSGSVIAGSYSWDWCEANLNECYQDGKTDSPEYGVAGISTIDGKPLWSTVLVEPVRHAPSNPPRIPQVRVEVAAESAIVATLTTKGADGKPAEVSAIGLDPATGKQRWSLDDFRPERASGDKIFGRVLQPGERDPLSRDAYPVVLDARTGREVWRGSTLGSWQLPGTLWEVPVAAEGFGIVYPAKRLSTSEPAATVIDFATGATYPFGRIGVMGRDSGGPFYAWAGFDGDEGRVHSQALSPDEAREGPEPTPSMIIYGVVDGYLWATTKDPDEPTTTAAYDRTGGRRLDPVPGQLKAFDQDWLVVEDDDGLTIRRLSR